MTVSARADGATVTITKAGSYLLQGKLENGQLIVDVEDDQKVELVFNGVDIKCSYNAPIYILSAPKKVVIKLYDGSVNLIVGHNTGRRHVGRFPLGRR